MQQAKHEHALGQLEDKLMRKYHLSGGMMDPLHKEYAASQELVRQNTRDFNDIRRKAQQEIMNEHPDQRFRNLEDGYVIRNTRKPCAEDAADDGAGNNYVDNYVVLRELPEISNSVFESFENYRYHFKRHMLLAREAPLEKTQESTWILWKHLADDIVTEVVEGVVDELDKCLGKEVDHLIDRETKAL